MKNHMVKKVKLLITILFASVFMIACGGGGGGSSATPQSPAFEVTSSDYEEGGEIPIDHACVWEGGSDVSPQLSWTGAPAETDSYAVIMDDETDPCGSGVNACHHWGVFNIPSTMTELDQGVDIDAIPGLVEGGYSGPCPPNKHTYTTSVYALGDSMPVLDEETIVLTRSEFESSYAEHILGEGKITGTFTPANQ